MTDLAHLRHLTDEGGLYEHARLTTPRPEHGYCVDDVARALVVLCREPLDDHDGDRLRNQYRAFVLASQTDDGRIRNRVGTDRAWSGAGTVDDCWGRALWSLGECVGHARGPADGAIALDAFARGARWQSSWSRATAYAALGAAAVLTALPEHIAARKVLASAAYRIGRPQNVQTWPWPEPRLTYGNAVIPEVLIAAGAALERDDLVDDGLLLLAWLLERESRDGHLSVTPVGGRGPNDLRPGFDQQPIEVAAIADACARAWVVTGGRRWADGVELAGAWFHGANDGGIALADPLSGGCCDGLEADGRNENQGAESTLAMLSTFQQVRRVTAAIIQ